MHRTAPRRIEAPPKRGKVTAHVDPDGTVYAVGGSGTGSFIVASALCMVIGAIMVMLHFNIPPEALVQPLPTAVVSTATARPIPTPPPAFGGAPEQPDYGQAAYNAAQQERAAQFATADAQPEPTPATASEAAIQQWLEGEPSTPTPLPEPGEAGFAESFEEAPDCSPFVGYLPGDPCIEILKQQAGE